MSENKNYSNVNIDDSILRDYAWKYFSLNAGQRIQTFQVYTSLSTAILGGTLIALKEIHNHDRLIQVMIGLLLVVLSILFLILELRTRALVEIGRNALRHLDDQIGLPDIDSNPNPLRIFAKEHLRQSKTLKYSHCFLSVFVLFIVIGIFIIVYSFI